MSSWDDLLRSTEAAHPTRRATPCHTQDGGEETSRGHRPEVVDGVEVVEVGVSSRVPLGSNGMRND